MLNHNQEPPLATRPTFKEHFSRNSRKVSWPGGYEAVYLEGDLYHIRHENGTQEWKRNGQQRLVKYPDGGSFWYKDGKVRRADHGGSTGQQERFFPDGVRRCGYPDGRKYYYKNDLLHCETGPAVVQSPQHVEFWLEGKKMTEQEFRDIAPQLAQDKKLRVLDIEVKAMGNGLKKPVKPLRQIRLKQQASVIA